MSMADGPSLAVLIACHNRKLMTLDCIRRLTAIPNAGWRLHVFLADDGCQDGTAAAVKTLVGSQATILNGSGSWYWNRGMLVAWRSARNRLPHAPALWLNDDVQLAADALVRLRKWHAETRGRAILVGQLSEPGTANISYGGVRHIPGFRFGFKLLANHGDGLLLCDTFNGNVVLVPPSTVARVGLLDGAFVHAYGDYDYGLRARRAGIQSLILPGFIGTCARGERPRTWRTRALPRRMRLRLAHRSTGAPILPALRFYGRHGGLCATVYAFSPYLRIMLGR